MAKKISQSKLNEIGGRVLEPKAVPVPKEKVDAPAPGLTKDQQSLVDQALHSAQAAEAQALRAIQITETQTALFQQLIDKMPVHDGLPPITGFTFQRDANNLAIGVTFTREKMRFN